MSMTSEEGGIVEAIANDEDLSARAKRIAEMMLARVEKIVRTGNDQALLGLASRVMPALMKAMGDRGGDENVLAEFKAMRAEFQAVTARPGAVEANPEAVEDTAPEGPVTGGGKPKPDKIRMSTKAATGAR